MPDNSNNYVFCADYSSMASCLAAIYADKTAGLYNAEQEILDRLNTFEHDLLKKLYQRVVTVLGVLEGGTDPALLQAGDFDDIDFSGLDFLTGYLEPGTGFSTQFQTVLNIFALLCSREAELSQEVIDSIAAVFIPVLEAFQELEELLAAEGFTPCRNTPAAYFNNAPEIRLQVAGSDGSGGIAQGILLRWLLNGELGNRHLPQGDYANALPQPEGFNRADDYVHISRTPYNSPVTFNLDFSAQRPAISALIPRWTYVLNMTRDGRKYTNTVILEFRDFSAYRALRRQSDPFQDPAGFLQGYTGQLDIRFRDKTVFRFGLTVRKSGTGPGEFKLAALARPDAGDPGDVTILRDRREFSGSDTVQSYTGENIRTLRLQTEGNSYPASLSFETYDDFLKSRPDNAWTEVGTGFGLSLDDTTVFKRLEEPGRVDINQAWPQYRDGTTLRVANYHDKWSRSTPEEPSVKSILSSYLSQSQTGEALLSFNPFGGEAVSLPYVDLLNMQAADYHFARMFGLGYIDTPAAAADDHFIYRMSYRNRATPDAELKDFEYLSMPVARSGHRLPATPLMRPLSYRLSADGEQDAGQFDAQGYNARNRVRLVNIGRAPAEAEIPEQDFFAGNPSGALFDHGANSAAVWYGLEYRRSDQETYVLPYITDDRNAVGRLYYAYNNAYHTAQGIDIPETTLLQDNDASLFLHLEKTPGIHEYAIYAVDLFSRPSELSVPVSTDETVFPPDNQLRSPTELTVQYIQKENTPVFSSEREQSWLSARDTAFPGKDTAYTRLTFNWVDITDVSGLDNTIPGYLNDVIKGNQTGVFYRPEAPLQLSGLIQAVTEVDETSVRVVTTAYSLLDGSTRQPLVSDTDLGKFTGSLLLTNDGQYEVLFAVNLAGTSGGAPVLALTVARNKVTEMADEDPENPGSTGTRSYYVSPARGGRFTLVENLSNAANWQQVRAGIALVDHSIPGTPVIDTIYDGQGKASLFWVGGIHTQATVSLARDSGGQIVPGYYQITCAAGTSLPPHPQGTQPFDPAALSPLEPHAPYVEWYNGKVFLPLPGDSGEKKSIDVVAIKNTAPLILYAYDPGYQSGDNPVLTPAEPQKTMTINYHPGYRAYLMTEPDPDNLNRDNLLPAVGNNDKRSMLAVQTIRQTAGKPTYVSPVSLPAILLALRIQIPLPPERPQAATLKVRPDATGRAAFTFDLPVPAQEGQQREPFGWTFYRTHHELVLHALYQPETVNDILVALGSFTGDPFFADRYLGLLELQFDPAAPGLFRQYPVTLADGSETEYGFPVPDLPELQRDRNGNILPPGSVERVAGYERAIHKTLMPLTEQTPILSYIKNGKQTENHPPVIRTIDGKLMNFGDQGFDAFPMIRRVPGNAGNYSIRFTDYTLRGSARFLYFYVAAEVTNRLEIGPLGGFTGPVTVLSTIPGEAPVVRSFSTGLNSGDGESPVAVTFRLSPFPGYDTITGARIFRTTEPDETGTLAAMGSKLDAALVIDPDTGGLTVTDDLADLDQVPLGETLYYRLAFIRRIINEAEEPEDVLSLGSEVLELKLVDSFNPEAPDLNYDPVSGSLQWQPTANKGIYYLYQQNSRGNWQVLSRVDNPDNAAMSFPVNLPGPDEDGNLVYSRFKVKAQNASGLFSLTDKELTI